MIRKTIVFFTTLIVAVSCVNAFAVPSVRQLGTNVSAGVEKPVTVLPNLPKSGSEVVRTVKTQAVDKEADEPARMAVINTKNSIKAISSSRIKQQQQAASSSNVSDAAFDGIISRVEALESKNALAGVTESGSGNYVTSVSVNNDDNTLNVEKTRVLYAPVRNEGSSAIVGDAEIWLVR